MVHQGDSGTSRLFLGTAKQTALKLTVVVDVARMPEYDKLCFLPHMESCNSQLWQI